MSETNADETSAADLTGCGLESTSCLGMSSVGAPAVSNSREVYGTLPQCLTLLLRRCALDVETQCPFLLYEFETERHDDLAGEHTRR